MKTIARLLLAIAVLFPAIHAWDYTDGYGVGGGWPSILNYTVFQNASSHADVSRTVQFIIGTQPFWLQTDLTKIHIPGANSSLNDPTAIFTLYSLNWPTEVSLNDILAGAEDMSNGRTPRLCASIPTQLFASDVVNGYDGDDHGSCVGALGQKCVDDLQAPSIERGKLDYCQRPDLPASCADKFPLDGESLAVTSLTRAGVNPEFTPKRFAYHSLAVETGTSEEDRVWEQALNRLHMVIFADQHSYHPVCMRIRDVQVDRNDPPANDAVSRGAAEARVLLVVFALSLIVFLTL